MFCKNCGKPVDGETASCPFCGEPLAAPPVAPAPVAAAPVAPAAPAAPAAPEPGLRKRAYYKRFFKRRNLISTAAILCYVCAAFTLVSGLFGPLGLWCLLDVGILLVLGLGIHLFRSRVCAILLLVYGIYDVVYMLIESGAPAGWLVVVAAGFAIAGTFGFSKEWRRYRAGDAGHPEA